MAALTGNKIKDSYLGLLKSIDNAPFSPRASGTFVQISDGGGNSLPLYLSTTSINFYNAYTFPSADGTISGQVLSTDANGTLSWVTSSDNQTLQEVLTQGNTTDLEITTSAQFNGDINGALLQKVKAAEVLSKGDVVYISGGTGDNPEVSKAKADSSTTMPALGIMKESLNNINDEGECITSGELTGLNLSSSGTIGDFDTGDELFVSSTTAGGLVDTAPTGEANLIQKIGKVIRGQNGGALTVLGAFRTNAMPNLPTGIILGDTTNVVTAITDGSVGQILSTDGNGTYSFIDDNAITSAVSPLNLSANQISLGTVGVSKGGTGAITLTGILLGDGTSAISGITSADDGHVLTADGNGGYAFEVSSGDVSISGTPTQNQIAIWTDGSTIKGMSALEISTDGTITLSQPNSDDPIVVTNSYNIGGGNIANVTGISNTGFGLDNLNAVTTGNRNVAFGYYSLKNLTIGTDNVAIGYAALQDVTEAIKCVAIGSEALNSVTTGHFNVAVGHTAGAYVSTSTRNTLVGYGSGSQLDTAATPSGGYNTFIGYQSGGSVTTGSKNVIIGSNGGSTIATLTNNIIISDGSGNNRIQVNSGGTATFSGDIIVSKSGDAGINLNSTTTNGVAVTRYGTTATGNLWATGINITNSDSRWEIYNFGLASSPLIISSGGEVKINTAGSGTSKLQVVGGIRNWNTALTLSSRLEPDGLYFSGAQDVYVVSQQALNFYAANALKMSISSLGTATFSGVVNIPVGAEATPSLIFAGDSDSGMWHPAANTLAFSTFGSERMRISSGGEATFANGTSYPLLELKTSRTDANYGIRLYHSDSTLYGLLGGTGSSILSGANTGDLVIRGQGDVVFASGGNNRRLTISSGGLATFTPSGEFAALFENTNTAGGQHCYVDIKSNGGSNGLAILRFKTDVAESGGTSAIIGSQDDLLFQTGVGDAYSTKMSISSGGEVGIGISQSTFALQVVGTMYSTDVKVNNLGSGSVFSNGAGILTNTDPSDSRLKTNIENIDYGLSEILKLRSVKFNWLDGDKNSKKQFGFIAQEVKEIIPESVSEFDYDDNKRFGLEKNAIYVGLVKAIQEQQTIIEDLKARIETLEG